MNNTTNANDDTPARPAGTILVNITFDEVNEDSARDGETSDSGVVGRNVPLKFRELVDLMRDFPNPSSFPNYGENHVWLSSHPQTDFRTGVERVESLHFSYANPLFVRRYWSKAMKAAGLLS